MSQRLKLFSRLRLRDLMPVPPAVAEYSTGLRMGDTAEQMAKTYGITRGWQDALAHRSHQRAAQAWSDGKLKEEVMTAFIPLINNRLSKTTIFAVIPLLLITQSCTRRLIVNTGR